jgi:hypothetical protein
MKSIKSDATAANNGMLSHEKKIRPWRLSTGDIQENICLLLISELGHEVGNPPQRKTTAGLRSTSFPLISASNISKNEKLT